MTVKANRLAWSLFFFFYFVRLNQSNKDVGSEEELHCTPSRSRSPADVPVPGFLYAHATRFVEYNTGQHVVLLKYANGRKTLTVVLACLAGYSGLVLDSTRSNVICNCTDDSIYMFNVSGVKTTPGKEGLHSG